MDLEHNVITRNGCLLAKKRLSKTQQNKIKKDLTVKPKICEDYGAEIEPFPVYTETDTHLIVPKYYSQKYIGTPVAEKLLIEPINVNFKGNLRDNQKPIIEKCLPIILNTGGGIISVACAGGKCFAKGTKIMLYNGHIKNVENIIIGDVLMGDDGTPRYVKSTVVSTEQMYNIQEKSTSEIKANYTVNESHILSLITSSNVKIDIELSNYLKIMNTTLLYGYRNNVIFSDYKMLSDSFMNSTIKTIIYDFYISKFKYKNNIVIKSTNLNSSFVTDMIFYTRSLGLAISKFGDDIYISSCVDNKYEIIITKTNVDNYYGFEIDGNNKRFLLNDFTVVHNTTMSLYLACKLGVKTLVLVHKSFLQDQWIERCGQFTDAKIGMIRQKKIDVKGKDIVIGMLQSVSMIDYDPSIFDGFGLVICDECFTYDTLILTSNGLQKIGSIYEYWKSGNSSYVMSYNENLNKFEHNQVTFGWKKHTTCLIKIYMENGYIECTPNHRLLTTNGYVEASNISIDDVIIGYNNNVHILSKKVFNCDTFVYDIEVTNNHNFVVFHTDINGIVVHNCHHFGSRVFSRAFSKVVPKYTIGLSATPIRADGLTKVFLWSLGDFMYRAIRKADKNVVIKTFRYRCNDKRFKEVKKYIKGKLKPFTPNMVSNLCEIKDRNTFCIDVINNLRKLDERKILVLSDRLEHLKTLKDGLDVLIQEDVNNGLLDMCEVRTAYYIGGMKEAHRNMSSQCDVIFATYQMAAEGLDIDSLNTLVLASPKKDIIQSIGRIMRKPIKEGSIKPLVIDIIDELSVFNNWASVRMNYYKKQAYKIETFHAINEKLVDLFDLLVYLGHLDKNTDKSSIDVRKEYICYEEGPDYYELVKENNFEFNPLENYIYSANYSDILNVNNDIEEIGGPDFIVLDDTNNML